MRMIWLGPALLLGCGGNAATQTSLGSLGTPTDVRADLPAAVRGKAPTDSAAATHEQTFDVHGASARITWRTFDDGPNKYIVSYEWSVVRGKEGVVLTAMSHLNPENAGTTAAAIQREIVQLGWSDTASGTSGQTGTVAFKIQADGTAMPN